MNKFKRGFGWLCIGLTFLSIWSQFFYLILPNFILTVFMDQLFERQKNTKATLITFVITTILFLIFFYSYYNQPIPPTIIMGEGIEVNLGNSETGVGDIAPEKPGNIGSAKSSSTANSATSNSLDEISPSDDDIAVNNNRTEKKTNNNPEKNNAPMPKPKAVFSGTISKNTGGNNADSYNGIRNQGIAGGKGNQGNPNGNPNSDSYNGNAASGNGGAGVAIRSGLDGRRITRLPSFEDDFNENAKVAVDITVDGQGIVIKATINPKGSTTTNANIRNIALQKARTLKLNPSESEEQTGTLIFNFKLRN